MCNENLKEVSTLKDKVFITIKSQFTYILHEFIFVKSTAIENLPKFIFYNENLAKRKYLKKINLNKIKVKKFLWYALHQYQR